MGAGITRKLLVGLSVAAAAGLGVSIPLVVSGPAAAQDIFRDAQVSVYAKDVGAEIQFYSVVGFKEQYRIPFGDPHPMFATIQSSAGGFFISLINIDALHQESGVWRIHPSILQDSDVTVLVVDVDTVVAQVRAAGYHVLMNPKDASWGERFALVEDPAGHIVQISTHRTGAPGT